MTRYLLVYASNISSQLHGKVEPTLAAKRSLRSAHTYAKYYGSHAAISYKKQIEAVSPCSDHH
jgi:hypothetical protein